jgi:hypothetical protein
VASNGRGQWTGGGVCVPTGEACVWDSEGGSGRVEVNRN